MSPIKLAALLYRIDSIVSIGSARTSIMPVDKQEYLVLELNKPLTSSQSLALNDIRRIRAISERIAIKLD